METNAWQQETDIDTKLFSQSSKFSFIQAIRLLGQGFENKEKLIEKNIRVRPRLSLDFPNSDIVDIKKENELIRLTVTFMGLYGESSPLPTFYTEILLQEEKDDKSVMRDFIDIFNAPIYRMYFKVWLKNQLGIRLEEFEDTKVLRFLHTFSGMPKEYLRKRYKNGYSFLKYAGLNMHYPRSAEALRVLISDIIKNKNVEIIQCVESTVSIPKQQHCLLGNSNTTLGDDAHIGDKIKDRMGKFRICVEELSLKEFNELLPHTKKFKSLYEAISLYIGDGFDWDLKLNLKKGAYENISLGVDDDLKLGLNTWLGEGKKPATLFINKNQYKEKYHDSK